MSPAGTLLLASGTWLTTVHSTTSSSTVSLTLTGANPALVSFTLAVSTVIPTTLGTPFGRIICQVRRATPSTSTAATAQGHQTIWRAGASVTGLGVTLIATVWPSTLVSSGASTSRTVALN
jgi:hypothetical protein